MQSNAIYIRLLLTLLLCYGVFIETGYVTTIAVFLIFVSAELTSVHMERTNKRLEALLDLHEKLKAINKG